jgi:hypothetical protein
LENQANLDRGIVEMFEVIGEEIRYGRVSRVVFIKGGWVFSPLESILWLTQTKQNHLTNIYKSEWNICIFAVLYTQDKLLFSLFVI